MPDAHDPPEGDKTTEGRTWLDILGTRMDEESHAGTQDSSQAPRAGKRMRFTDLAPPAAQPSSAAPASAADSPATAGLREQLRISEEQRQAAEARVRELEVEVAAMQGAPVQPDAREVARLRLQLAEAHEIIKAIEQAYLAGESGGGTQRGDA